MIDEDSFNTLSNIQKELHNLVSVLEDIRDIMIFSYHAQYKKGGNKSENKNRNKENLSI